MKSNDIAEPSNQPQMQFSPVPGDPQGTAQAISRSPIGGPGDIVARLGLQFQLPRNSPDSEISRDHFHNNLGEIG
jgi:hypothetical protein